MRKIPNVTILCCLGWFTCKILLKEFLHIYVVILKWFILQYCSIRLKVLFLSTLFCFEDKLQGIASFFIVEKGPVTHQPSAFLITYAPFFWLATFFGSSKLWRNLLYLTGQQCCVHFHQLQLTSYLDKIVYCLSSARIFTWINSCFIPCEIWWKLDQSVFLIDQTTNLDTNISSTKVTVPAHFKWVPM